MKIAQILLPLPLPEAFDYEVRQGLDLAVGDFVKIPLAKAEKLGVVVSLRNDNEPPKPLKQIIERLDAAPLTKDSLAFIEWAAKYLVVPQGVVLHQVMRANDALFAGPFATKITIGSEKID
ncbi:MAG: primosomal protein N' (replication factor Y) (superfamily II helicase), partial [Hyphomonadaceae bacterium]